MVLMNDTFRVFFCFLIYIFTWLNYRSLGFRKHFHCLLFAVFEKWNVEDRHTTSPLTHSHTMTPFDAPGKQAF